MMMNRRVLNVGRQEKDRKMILREERFKEGKKEKKEKLVDI